MIFHRLTPAAVFMGMRAEKNQNIRRESDCSERIGVDGESILRKTSRSRSSWPIARSSIQTAERSSIVMLPLDRPDRSRVFLQRVQMYHPIEDNGMKFSARRIALRLCRNRSPQTKFGLWRKHVLLAFWSLAEIHMLMPLRDTKRNALVQVVFTKTFGRRVHHAHQPILVAILLIQQRSRMFRIKLESRFER